MSNTLYKGFYQGISGKQLLEQDCKSQDLPLNRVQKRAQNQIMT